MPIVEGVIQDPMLAEALDEIEEVLRRRHLAGTIVLASSTHAAYRSVLPEWSGVQVNDRGIRIKIRGDDPEHAAATMHLVLSVRDLLLYCTAIAGQLADAVLLKLKENGVEVVHGAFGGDEPEAKT